MNPRADSIIAALASQPDNVMAAPELAARMGVVSSDDTDTLYFSLVDTISAWIRDRFAETPDFEAICRVAANETIDAAAFVIRVFKEDRGECIDPARFALIGYGAAEFVRDWEDFPDARIRTFSWYRRRSPRRRAAEAAPKLAFVDAIVPEQETGSGSEKVYVYYYAADRDLAQRDGRETWPCKVGFTAQPLTTRILQQHPVTGMHRPPVIGLVIHTANGRVLERAVHAALTEAGSRIDSAYGREWFSTSPSKIADWFGVYSGTVATLKAAS